MYSKVETNRARKRIGEEKQITHLWDPALLVVVFFSLCVFSCSSTRKLSDEKVHCISDFE